MTGRLKTILQQHGDKKSEKPYIFTPTPTGSTVIELL